MPSQDHETWIEELRTRPELAAMFLRSVGHARELADGWRPEVASASLTSPAPAERQADLLVLREGTRARLVIVIEVQLRRDPKKVFRWPHYEAAARDRYECPAILLVFAPRPHVARWAAQPIPMGAGGRICPVVIGRSDIPIVSNLEEARRAPELAVLSAVANGRGEPGLETDLLRKTFGELPSSATERLEAADLPTLERWLEASLSARALAPLFTKT